MEETLKFSHADFGPIKASKSEPVEIKIKPLTVFIGVQGSGKSLASQLLYFLRDSTYLMANYAKGENYENTIRKVVDRLRSTDQSLGTFVSKGTAQIHYSCKTDSELKRSISINKNLTISPIKAFNKEFEVEIKELLNKLQAKPSLRDEIQRKALFIPAERTLFSRFLNSGMPTGLPIPMREFENVLARGRDIYTGWLKKEQEMPQEAIEIEHIVQRSLRGSVRYEQAGLYSGKWQWVPDGREKPIQIAMASSGQMEAWPLVFAAQTAFSLKQDERPIFLHIEEPEAHLHPSAQVAMVHILAYLVNQGFRVLVTTHSLTVLYTINNLMAAYQMLPGKTYEDVPAENVRLSPDDLSAYLFTGEGVEEVMYKTDELRQIDEGRLGEVLGNLQIEFNRIAARATYGE